MRQAHRRAHGMIWPVMAVLLPAILVLSLALRRGGPEEAAPLRLSPPAEAPR